MKSGVVLGVGGMTSEGWMKKPGAEGELEGREFWMEPMAEAFAAAEVVWCSLASSLAFWFQRHRQQHRENQQLAGPQWKRWWRLARFNWPGSFPFQYNWNEWRDIKMLYVTGST